ncbi:MAG: B12-binding domain-containing radical SAM protein [Candidatus Omnitrophota bacterium]|nr:MAG: B12-binding domain-containing radical SAM protein [Candidatus Omnitrophota bacterium]
MKILLIKPKWFVDGDPYNRYHDLTRVPPLGLGIIAALSEGHEVKIVDEDVEEIEYSPDWDLAGLTVVTFTAKSAYRISERFRSYGVKTVLGGPHPSLVPEEAGAYCDSVLIEEAETVWKKILKDAERGFLQKVYYGGYLKNLDEVPLPRRDLFARSYFHSAIQFTRGCRNHCTFCYLQSVPWKEYRKRSPEHISREMSQIKGKYLFIIDDNLFIDRTYVKEVLKAISSSGKRWWIQASTSVAEDEEVLDLMVQSGCYAVSIGFQSVDHDSLSSAKAIHNIGKEYKRVVKNLHRREIFVAGYFMFGFDSENANIFRRTIETIKEMELDDALLYILTPYPGTELFKRLQMESRIIDCDWSKYSWYRCHFKPKYMSQEELEEGLKRAYLELNRYFRGEVFKKIWKNRGFLFRDIRLANRILRNHMNKVVLEKIP